MLAGVFLISLHSTTYQRKNFSVVPTFTIQNEVMSAGQSVRRQVRTIEHPPKHMEFPWGIHKTAHNSDWLWLIYLFNIVWKAGRQKSPNPQPLPCWKYYSFLEIRSKPFPGNTGHVPVRKEKIKVQYLHTERRKPCPRAYIEWGWWKDSAELFASN